MKLSVVALRAWASTMRHGCGVRAAASKGAALTMSPRYAGRVTPSRVSPSSLRGFAYWPAKRPMRVTRRLPPCTSTRLICRRILRRAAIEPGSQPSNVSAQSPPCRMNRSPAAASASWRRSASISKLVTSGGSAASSRRAASSAARSGHSGCWSVGRDRHEDGAQPSTANVRLGAGAGAVIVREGFAIAGDRT